MAAQALTAVVLAREEEVMELLGIGPGPRVGEVLDFLLDQQIEGAITTREEALAVVRERFADQDKTER